jgi:hypothetical protein
MSVEQIRHCLRTRRWVRVASGVYQTAPGKSGWEVDAAAALLAVTGRGPTDLRSDKGRLQSPPVALFGTAAARAWEMPGVARAPIQLAISAPRTITPVKGAALRRIGRWDERVDPLTFPWRTTKASTVIDCAAGSEPDGALAWLALAVQKRLVPVETLEAELAKRTRLRHGALMREAMADVTSGAHSAAEVRYVRDVERAHRLPTAIRQSASRVNGGSVHDNDYADFGVVIEVDGRLGHEEWASRIKDGRRDRRLGGGASAPGAGPVDVVAHRAVGGEEAGPGDVEDRRCGSTPPGPGMPCRPEPAPRCRTGSRPGRGSGRCRAGRRRSADRVAVALGEVTARDEVDRPSQRRVATRSRNSAHSPWPAARPPRARASRRGRSCHRRRAPDLDVGAVVGADRQRAVEGELHVAGARGLLAGERDLLGQVGRRDELLGEGDVVVGREGDDQAPLDARVG